MISLNVIKGAAEGLEVETNAQQISLGRSVENAIVIPDSFVSRRHGEIQIIDGIYEYRDLHSKHGTFLWRNGKREFARRVILIAGDELDLGGLGNIVRVNRISMEGVAEEKRALRVTHKQREESLPAQDLLTADSKALQLMVEFDTQLLSAACTIERQFYEALLQYIPRILQKLDYVAILEWSDNRVRHYDFRLGTHEGKVRLSSSVISMVREENRGVVFDVANETLVAEGNRSVPISDESRVVELRFAGDRSGICLPIRNAYGPPKFLQFERASASGKFRQTHLDLAAAMVSRVADRIENLQLVRQNHRLHVSASLGIFAGMMGHDIKNYLFYSKELSKIQHEPLSAHPGIIKGIERARKLAQGMKDMAAPGNQPLTTFPLNGLLESIMTEFSSLFGGNCGFETGFDAGVGEITTNEDLLSRAIWNLVMNAYHASENRRASITEAPYVRLETGLCGENVHIRIADNAGGLGPQTHEYLLRSFELIESVYREELDIIDAVAEFSSLRGYTNSIGLFFTAMAIYNLRGAINVETVQGHGTIFTVEIPQHIESLWRLVRL